MDITIQFNIFTLFKIIGLAVGSVILIFLIYRLYKGAVGFFRRKDYQLDREGIKKRWKEIENMLRQPGEMNYKLAVLEADKLIDFVLKSMSMPGKDMGERLRFACFKYNKLRRVWWAHSLRNQLVHEATASLNYSLAKRAIKTFKGALQELGVL